MTPKFIVAVGEGITTKTYLKVMLYYPMAYSRDLTIVATFVMN